MTNELWLKLTRRTARVLMTLALLAGLSVSVAAQEDTETAAEPVVLDQRPGEGERCIVCRQQVYGADVVELRYLGRRFFVKAQMLEEFESDPARYFASLQARSGLFDERAVGGGRVSYGWLGFGAYVVLGLVFAAMCGYLAIGWGHPPLPWFFAGLAGNVAALFVLWAAPRGDLTALPAGVPAGLAKVPVTRQPVPCPCCGTTNHPSAAACAGCDESLTPAVEPETARI